MLLGIDPGTTQSAWVLMSDTGDLFNFGITDNYELEQRISWSHDHDFTQADEMVIEEIRSYGRPVGRETFVTVEWIGIFRRAFGLTRAFKLPRLAVKEHLCHSGKAKDAHIRQALIDRWGGQQAIRKGGPLYKVSKDVWQALGLAVTWKSSYLLNDRVS